jgi:hypothetical protein
MQGRGPAIGGALSALAGLTALTRLDLNVNQFDPPWAEQPVLPWAHIEVGAAAAYWEGCQPGRAPRGCKSDARHLAPALWTLCDVLRHAHHPSQRVSGRRAGLDALPSARPPGCQMAPLTHAPHSLLPCGPPPRVRRISSCGSIAAPR